MSLLLGIYSPNVSWTAVVYRRPRFVRHVSNLKVCLGKTEGSFAARPCQSDRNLELRCSNGKGCKIRCWG